MRTDIRTLISFLLAKLAFLATVTVFSPFVAAQYTQPPTGDIDARTLQSYSGLVREFESRRRLQFLFPNPQTIFDGLNIGFVQTSTGNLTFLRRDVVLLTEKIVIARVHDSQFSASTGLGPNWHLNVLESIDLEDGVANYFSGNGSKIEFVHKSRAMYSPKKATPQLTGTTLAIIGNEAVIRNRQGEIRQFKRVGSSAKFTLVRRVLSNGFSTTFEYDQNRINRISADDETIVRFEWKQDRIHLIVDRYGRSVKYEYDEGLLRHVTDLSGQNWSYEYNEQDQLEKAKYPDGSIYLAVEYSNDGRVTESNSARNYRFRYFDDYTSVEEPGINLHTFVRNQEGITIGYRSDKGIKWSAVLDSSNRLTDFNRNGDLYEFAYHGNLIHTIEHPEGTWIINYDERGRLTHSEGVAPRSYEFVKVNYSGDREFSINSNSINAKYVFDSSNRLIEVESEEGSYLFEYDRKGQIKSIKKGLSIFRFVRDELGRIISTRYPNGKAGKYFYDSLGNRNLAVYSGGASLSLEHDVKGNIVSVVDTSAAQVRLMQSYVIDEHNRVLKVSLPGSTVIEVEYDSFGRPIELDINEINVSVDYDGLGHVLGITSGELEWRSSLDRTQFSAFRSSLADPRGFFHDDLVTDAQPNYGLLYFSENLDNVSIVQIDRAAVPGLIQSNKVMQTIGPLFHTSFPQLHFEKPSNPVFQPPEYKSTNCCVNCPFGSPCGQYCTTYFGTSEFTCNCQDAIYCVEENDGSQCDVPSNGNGTGSTCTSTDKNSARATVVASLGEESAANYEVGMYVDCPDTGTLAWTGNSSSDRSNCLVISPNTHTLYAGHTHAVYTSRDIQKFKVCCTELSARKCSYIYSDRDITQLNNGNRSCSIADGNWVSSNNVPLLMRMPIYANTPVDCK